MTYITREEFRESFRDLLGRFEGLFSQLAKKIDAQEDHLNRRIETVAANQRVPGGLLLGIVSLVVTLAGGAWVLQTQQINSAATLAASERQGIADLEALRGRLLDQKIEHLGDRIDRLEAEDLRQLQRLQALESSFAALAATTEATREHVLYRLDDLQRENKEGDAERRKLDGRVSRFEGQRP